MRSELGKITLDKSFEERSALNDKIVVSTNLPASFVIKYLLYCHVSIIITCESWFAV